MYGVVTFFFLWSRTCTGLRVALAPQPAKALYESNFQQQDNAANDSGCVIVAHLHVRKCAGTSLRLMFKQMKTSMGWDMMGDLAFKDGIGDYKAWIAKKGNLQDPLPFPSLSFPSPPFPSLQFPSLPFSSLAGKYYAEFHGDEDIQSFNEEVAKMRKLVEPKCKVVTTTILRSPIEQVLSSYGYFCSNSILKPETRDVAEAEGWYNMSAYEYSMAHPEIMFKRLLFDSGVQGFLRGDTSVWKNFSLPKSGGPGTSECGAVSDELASCPSAQQTLDQELSKIDIVGRADSIADFTRYVVKLGEAAGFDPLALPDNFVEGKQNAGGHSFSLNQSEYVQVAKRQGCYSEWYAKWHGGYQVKENNDMKLSKSFDRASELARRWARMDLDYEV